MAVPQSAQTSTNAPDPIQFFFQQMANYIGVASIYTTTRARIPDLLVHGPRPVSELARETGFNEDALYRVMRLLGNMGVYEEVGLRHFRLTPLSEALRSDSNHPARPAALWSTNPFHLRAYAELEHSLRTGETCVEKITGGVPVFDYFSLPGNEELIQEFDGCMAAVSAIALPPVLEAYDFSGIGTLVDVAGNHGSVIGRILQRYPEMRGVVFDLPHVVMGAKKMLRDLGVAERCEIAAGDMFRSVPRGDSYIMKYIIHDWDDARCIRLLSNCVKSMNDPAKGRVILLESIVSTGSEPDFTKAIDIEMLALPGGKERTADEYADLFNRAGMRLERIVPVQGPLQVIEARVNR